jgi:hypothetical protein
VKHHVGVDFVCEADDLFIIDESDVLIFSESLAFKAAICNNRCICLTGTPDNQDNDGLERRLVNKFNFARFDSIVGRDKSAVVIS